MPCVKGVTIFWKEIEVMLEHMICDGFQDNCYYWKFHEKHHREITGLGKTIRLIICYDYHDDIYDILNQTLTLTA